MADTEATKAVRELTIPVPVTLDEALAPEFLSKALGRAVASVEVVELRCWACRGR